MNSKDIYAILIALYADQEGVTITYGLADRKDK